MLRKLTILNKNASNILDAKFNYYQWLTWQKTLLDVNVTKSVVNSDVKISNCINFLAFIFAGVKQFKLVSECILFRLAMDQGNLPRTPKETQLQRSKGTQPQTSKGTQLPVHVQTTPMIEGNLDIWLTKLKSMRQIYPVAIIQIACNLHLTLPTLIKH